MQESYTPEIYRGKPSLKEKCKLKGWSYERMKTSAGEIEVIASDQNLLRGFNPESIVKQKKALVKGKKDYVDKCMTLSAGAIVNGWSDNILWAM